LWGFKNAYNLGRGAKQRPKGERKKKKKKRDGKKGVANRKGKGDPAWRKEVSKKKKQCGESLRGKNKWGGRGEEKSP